MAKAHKRNPQDSTLRNVRAAKKALTTLIKRVDRLEMRIERIGIFQGTQEARIRHLERRCN